MNPAQRLKNLGDQRSEVVKKALQCQTAEEIMELAETLGAELTKPEAQQLLGALQAQTRELSDRELEAATGGYQKDGELCYTCFHWSMVPSSKGDGWFYCTNIQCKDYHRDVYHPLQFGL